MNQPLAAIPEDSSRPDAAGVDDARFPVLAHLRRLSPGQIIGLGMTLIGVLGFFAYLTVRILEPDYTLLYGGLDLEDSAAIVARLESLGVPYRLHGSGEAILIPADRVARLRMTMAEEGLPRGGSIGDEIFDQTGALGMTTFLANINERRALEGELARTIATLMDVKAARVHLVLPKRELFRRNRIEPSASVTLRMFGGRRLNPRQVSAVQHLVAASVPGLLPERITLVDDRGSLLVKSGDGTPEGELSGEMDGYRIAYETRLKTVIEQLLEPVLGPGRVHAEVNVDIDLDRITSTEETFDPESQVARSTQSIEEETDRAERDKDGTVTVGNNLPNTAAGGEGGGRTNNENTVRTEETVNYEISRTVRNHTRVGGRVKRLSVAVLVAGREAAASPEDQPSYVALEPEELAEITSLVRSAIGFDAERGDVIEVKNMPFVQSEMDEIEPSLFDLTKNDILRLVELGALVLVALMAIFLVVRPTIARLLPEPVTLDAPVAEAVSGAGSNLPVALDEHGKPLPVAVADGPADGMNRTGDGATGSVVDRIDSAEFENKVTMDLIQQSRDLIEARPDDAVSIIRQWIGEEKGEAGA